MKMLGTLKPMLLATAIAFGTIAATSAPASAYVVCNRVGDCWHTDSRVHFRGVRLTFHPDSWWNRHKSNHHYTWHEVDTGHDWHHGYWERGTWHAL